MKYDASGIEKKWQKVWEDRRAFHAENTSDKPKWYSLVEFPYPSGQGLHIGHPRPYTAMDIVSRKRRMQGYNVLFPIGWDAFGLPTENYAIRTHTHPAKVTHDNIAHFTQQAKAIVNDRAEIVAGARREAEGIIKKAEDRARALVDQQEIVRQAQQKAAEMLSAAQQQSREMRTTITDYCENMLRQTEEILARSAAEVKNVRGALRQKAKNGG